MDKGVVQVERAVLLSLRKDQKRSWSLACQTGFDKVETVLVIEPVQGLPEFKPSEEHMEASVEKVLGGALMRCKIACKECKLDETERCSVCVKAWWREFYGEFEQDLEPRPSPGWTSRPHGVAKQCYGGHCALQNLVRFPSWTGLWKPKVLAWQRYGGRCVAAWWVAQRNILPMVARQVKLFAEQGRVLEFLWFHRVSKMRARGSLVQRYGPVAKRQGAPMVEASWEELKRGCARYPHQSD